MRDYKYRSARDLGAASGILALTQTTGESNKAIAARVARAVERMHDTEPYSIYSLRDAGGVSRYVGITRRAKNRFKSHARTYPDLTPVILMTNVSPIDAFVLEGDLQRRLTGLRNKAPKSGSRISPHRYKTYPEYRRWVETRVAPTQMVYATVPARAGADKPQEDTWQASR